ncbi:MAG: primosomal protein N' [Bacteroidales bacterium]|nr:primosomal protein N' [Bacteroidales bacterium]
MEPDKTYILVILPLRLSWEPCYSAPADVEAGDRVRVVFSGKEYIAVVSATGVEPRTSPEKISEVLAVERDMERVGLKEIEFWRHMASYYLCSVGEVYKAAYPSIKMEEKGRESVLRKTERLKARLARLEDLIPRARSAKGRYETEVAGLRAEIAGLENGEYPPFEPLGNPITLSKAQKKAFDDVTRAAAGGKPVLISGVTGSGKTEIYISLALKALNSGRNVLYLVPEIALSRQMEERMAGIFGPCLRVFHSGETEASRREATGFVRRGRYIVLGTRSSLFLPHNDLGLVIIDEEQDTSYKQDSPAPRYNGRDSAVMLARLHGASVVMGSATPSLESLYNCRTGKYSLVSLEERYHGAPDSEVMVIDTISERRKRGMVGNFSRKLIEAIRERLYRGEQVMILRARRSWAPAVQCRECGKIIRCPHCNIPLSLHKGASGERLVCHYCGHSEPFPPACPHCGGELAPLGSGTQKIEEEASALFPDAAVARLDSDSAQNREYMRQTIDGFAEGKIDILVGTQMVAKGFDFSGLTLVAVLQADVLLGQQDFRADERAVQLLEQFRGRCGRRGSKGLFIIQTTQPDHPVYSFLTGRDTGLDERMLQERKHFSYPPYSRVVNIVMKDTNEARLEKLSRELAAEAAHALGTVATAVPLPTEASVRVVGPYSPAADRLAGEFIRHIRVSLLKDSLITRRKAVLKKAVDSFVQKKSWTGHVALDVDPIQP